MKKRRILYLILLILWCGIIFLFSDKTSKESNTTSKKIIETTAVETTKTTNKMKITNIDTNNKEWRKQIIEAWNVPIRKTAHATIYFVLAIIFYLFLISMRVNPKKAVLWTIAFCFLYSTTDEIHQTFVLERTGQLLDCIIDTLGATLGSIVIYQITKNMKSKLEENTV